MCTVAQVWVENMCDQDKMYLMNDGAHAENIFYNRDAKKATAKFGVDEWYDFGKDYDYRPPGDDHQICKRSRNKVESMVIFKTKFRNQMNFSS